MKFVENEKLQSAAVIDHAAVDVLVSREDQLQHHEVSQQNVGRVVGDCLALIPTLLAGVALDCERLLALGVAMQEFVQFLDLAIGQGVHWIDDDGSRARFRLVLPCLEDAVDNGDKE